MSRESCTNCMAKCHVQNGEAGVSTKHAARTHVKNDPIYFDARPAKLYLAQLTVVGLFFFQYQSEPSLAGALPLD